MRRLAAVDLREARSHTPRTCDCRECACKTSYVFGVADPAAGEEPRLRRIAGEEVGDVVGRAAHQPERLLGPALSGQTFGAEVLVRVRNLEAAPDRAAGIGRGKRHAVPVLGRRRVVEQAGDRTRAVHERGVARRVADPLAVHENLALAGAEVGQEALTCAQWRRHRAFRFLRPRCGRRAHHASP